MDNKYGGIMLIRFKHMNFIDILFGGKIKRPYICSVEREITPRQ